MRKLLFAFFSLSLFLFPSPVLASESDKFSLAYDLSYKVSESGNTNVTENVHLTNLTTEFFASEYVLKIQNTQINALKAYDKTGPLPIDIQTKNGSNEVHIKFRDTVVGINKTLHWTLVYDTPEVATKIGSVWEIFIPPAEKSPNTQSYTVGLYVPTSFGTPLFLKPSPETSPNIWDKTHSQSGIIAAYSTSPETPFASYDFSLVYHLHNPKLYRSPIVLALPPDTNYQKIFLRSLDPPPDNVTIDPDGNWLASYLLAPNSNLDILAQGSAAVFLKPRFPSPPTETAPYLRGAKYWDVGSPQVQKVAQNLHSARDVYRYVVDHLRYDPTRITKNSGRAGSVAVLSSPSSAICMEFTDLFIALARSVGIPAREVNGFALTQDKNRLPLSLQKDVLHAWPEYFDTKENTWLMVDPTWGNTTGGLDFFDILDFNHLAFSLHGLNSVTPAPAGAYKLPGGAGRDVSVIPTNRELDISLASPLTLTATVPPETYGGLSTTVLLTAHNNGPTVSAPQSITVAAGVLAPESSSLSVALLPPFGHQDLLLKLAPSSYITSTDDIISFRTAAGSESHYPIKILPIYRSPTALVLGGLFAIAILSIITKVAWSLFFQKRSR